MHKMLLKLYFYTRVYILSLFRFTSFTSLKFHELRHASFHPNSIYLLSLYTPRNRLQCTQLQLQICVQHALGIPVGRNLPVFQIFVSSSVTIANQEEEISVQIPLLRSKILGSKTAVQDTH